jgi:pyochelin biosynthetic protein PchC
MGEGTASRISLVCCPHAGGTAEFFRDWPRWFPADIQVVAAQYPGHGDRVDDPCLADVHQLSAKLAPEVERLRPSRVILFGHSFGAAIAFEVAVRLAKRGSPPRAIVISARGAPHHACGGRRLRGDAAIWREMVRLGGTPPEIAADPEWRELLTPSLRADFHANATYRPSRIRLSCPMTVMFGRDDDLACASVNAWREYTESEFAVREFGGAHFYLSDHVADIAAEVARLASREPEGSPPVRAEAPHHRPRSGASHD